MIGTLKKVVIVAILLITSCAPKLAFWSHPKPQYGYVAIVTTSVFQKPNGQKTIHELPAYHSESLPDETINIDAGYVRIQFESPAEKGKFKAGWVAIDDIKLFRIQAPATKAITPKQFEQYSQIQGRAKEYIADWNKDMSSWHPEYKKAIRQGKILIGMTWEMVLLAVGIPNTVNKNTGNPAIDETWEYRQKSAPYHSLSLTEGKVVKIE